VALVDTNCDPDDADYVIPGNDDAIRSCSLIVRVIADAIEAGKSKVTAEEMAPPAPAEEPPAPAEEPPAPAEEPPAPADEPPAAEDEQPEAEQAAVEEAPAAVEEAPEEVRAE
jgi:small subunit ribosomal protein S2